ncbi:MAG: hypothetical protein NC213_07880 [Acetobacter sp.]|nr:hypothetical protein [Bacteroides sp.]MCM1341649.1 hypothetical protein [Acetobacter sp.]MCM1434031.1 hypothetical protein [Clostridiales bacterium]
MTENKRDRFVRIAENRTNRIIDTLRLLTNCANKSNYDYTDEDIKKIFNAIEKEIKNAKNAFSGGDCESERFTLR